MINRFNVVSIVGARAIIYTPSLGMFMSKKTVVNNSLVSNLVLVKGLATPELLPKIDLGISRVINSPSLVELVKVRMTSGQS